MKALPLLALTMLSSAVFADVQTDHPIIALMDATTAEITKECGELSQHQTGICLTEKTSKMSEALNKAIELRPVVEADEKDIQAATLRLVAVVKATMDRHDKPQPSPKKIAPTTVPAPKAIHPAVTAVNTTADEIRQDCSGLSADNTEKCLKQKMNTMTSRYTAAMYKKDLTEADQKPLQAAAERLNSVVAAVLQQSNGKTSNTAENAPAEISQ